ncbi:hypothetical protein ASC94_06005 [Massilia sp. Root418]|jgi:hypothetical protein|uniref:hypothetical protein n=1 Tax=Massilia sp. Root418 TaxID=1736532 RepID=UPI0006FBE8FF|nr:hypothetical protein [Massilia sp. Root418]KQW96405.1 hypothetical protein ASC94_06005 [Massilia sp. Root418]
MKLIAEKRSSNDKYDVLRFVRNNGSATDTLMPRQGILPHNLIHYVVESALPLRHGFLSQVALGADAQIAARAAQGADNPAVPRQAAQVEAIVEGLQTQLWRGSFDLESFLAAANSACAARGHPPLDLAGIDVHACLYQRAQALHAQWQEIPYHRALSLDFSPRLG